VSAGPTRPANGLSRIVDLGSQVSDHARYPSPEAKQST
jgi:hypothetical protein